MKKALLGTTALVAGGLFATAVVAADLSPAPEPEPIEEGFTLNVSGFMTAFFLFTSDDDLNTTHDTDTTRVSLSSEIKFVAEQTLANGLTITGTIELEAQNSNAGTTNIDEAYLTLAGSWGTFTIGGQDGALNSGDVGISTAGIYGEADGPSFASISVGGPTSAIGAATGTFSGVTSDANKLIYFTPRMSGVQLGVSFTPNTVNGGPVFNSGTPTTDSGDSYLNVWDVVANLEHSWGDYKIVVAGGYESAEAGQTGAAINTGNVDIWNAGVTLESSYGTLGFKYTERDHDSPTATLDDMTAWTVQGTIKSGDTTFGAGYFQGDGNITGGGTNEFDRFYVGVDHALAAGVTIGAFVAVEDLDVAGGSASDNDGVVGGAGMSISF